MQWLQKHAAFHGFQNTGSYIWNVVKGIPSYFSIFIDMNISTILVYEFLQNIHIEVFGFTFAFAFYNWVYIDLRHLWH